MSKQKSSDERINEKQNRETVDAFLARGGRIEQCEPEEAPPQYIQPRYGSGQKRHFIDGDKSKPSHCGRSKKGAVRFGRLG